MIEFDSINYSWEDREDGSKHLIIMVKGVEHISEERKKFIEKNLTDYIKNVINQG